jgi:Tol biopolymer transport system component
MTVSAVATTGEIGQVRHFVVSPNGEKILFVSEKSDAEDHSWASVMLFDFARRDVIGLTGEVKEVVLSPDEEFIASVENDNYYGNSLVVMTNDGGELKLRYHHHIQSFSQLRWSKDSKYLTFVSDGSLYKKQTVVISPQVGVVPSELATVEWQESKQLKANHPLYQKKPIVRADSTVLWGDDKTIYIQAMDGIWKGSLDEAFIVRWTQLVAAEDITGPQVISISPQGTHLLYNRVKSRSSENEILSKGIWVLPLKAGATPVNIVEEGWARAQFTPDGQSILVVNLGLWIVSLDGSSKRQLTRQKSLP